VNGTEVWVNPSGANTIDTSWVPMEIDISAFDGNPNVTIEFRLTSDGGLTFGGWNIDDVEIVSLRPTRLADVWADVRRVGRALGRAAEGERAAAEQPPAEPASEQTAAHAAGETA